MYVPVMSTAAIRLLQEYGIEYVYDHKTEAIFNRTRTDLCPMENAVRQIEDPHQALNAIQRTLDTLNAQK